MHLWIRSPPDREELCVLHDVFKCDSITVVETLCVVFPGQLVEPVDSVAVHVIDIVAAQLIPLIVVQ